MRIRSILLPAAAVALPLMISWTAPALAADLPPKLYTKAPPVAVPGWAGTYTGVVASYGWGHSDHTDPGLPPGDGQFEQIPNAAAGSFDTRGAALGLTLGYNWQSGPWVYGFEADYSWSDIRGSSVCNLRDDFGVVGQCGTKLDSYGTFRGRVGYAAGATGNWLLYVTGGFAAGDLQAWNTVWNTSGREMRPGWTAGGGVETRIAPNWSVKVEYLHIDLGSAHLFDSSYQLPETVTFKTDLVRFGLNYKWDPVGNPMAIPPTAPAVFNWTGLYLGGHGGTAQSRSFWTFQQDDNWFNFPHQAALGKTNATFGGVQAGFNYQFDHIVLGLEGTWSKLEIDTVIAGPFEIKSRVSGLSTVAGRLGFAWDRVMIYGRGGWAQARVEPSLFYDGLAGGDPVSWNPGAKTRNGSIVGGGVEFMVTPNIIVGVEYNHIDLGKQFYEAANIVPDFESTSSMDDRTTIDMVTGRLSFKFDPFKPF